VFHNNACLHTAACTQALLEHFDMELFDHPHDSPDLTLNGCHLFTCLKSWLESQCFSNNEELIGVRTWLSSQAADFCDTCIQTLTPQYDKCLNSSNDYIEK
jgi:hypothetical protein